MLQVPAMYKNRRFNKELSSPLPPSDRPCVMVKLWEAGEKRKVLSEVNSSGEKDHQEH